MTKIRWIAIAASLLAALAIWLVALGFGASVPHSTFLSFAWALSALVLTARLGVKFTGRTKDRNNAVGTRLSQRKGVIGLFCVVVAFVWAIAALEIVPDTVIGALVLLIPSLSLLTFGIFVVSGIFFEWLYRLLK